MALPEQWDAERRSRACFDGLLLMTLAYGALVMLCFQLCQVMLLRPKRGRTFYGIIAFSLPIFILATIAIGGRFRFAEMVYIENRMFTDGPLVWYMNNSDRWENVMTMSCTIVLPWIGNLLMLHRVYILWNSRRWILGLPFLIYLADVALSIPFLIALSRPHDPVWASNIPAYSTASSSLTVTFNLLVTVLIVVRLRMLQSKVEQVMGKVQSIPYTSPCTYFVESGAFFSLWKLVYLILFTRNSWVQDVFLQPAMHIAAITRIMIVLRIAQNTAWSKDIITASGHGILDWQVSSSQSHTIPMHTHSQGNSSASFPGQEQIKALPKKFRDEGMVY